MMEQVLGIAAIAIIGIWAIAMVVAQILYLIASFRSSVGLTLLSFIVPFLGLYVLVKFWENLKKPFLNQLGVGLGGFALIFLGGMALNAMGVGTSLPRPGLPIMAKATPPDRPPAIQAIKTIQSRPLVPLPPPPPATPAEQPATPATVPTPAPGGSPEGEKVAILDTAAITMPPGWVSIPWTLPTLAVAMGDPERGEFAVVRVFDKDSAQTFADFQKAALQEAFQDVIDGSAPSNSRRQTVNGLDAVTFGMSGKSRLVGQAASSIAARVSCIDGTLRRYAVIQWRTAAWDDASTQTFNRFLDSFAEIDGE